MAEIILSAVLPVVLDKLTSAALKKIARSQEIHSQLKKWKTSLPLIQDVLVDAAQKEITEKAVKRWLDDLRHLAYDMDDVLDELATKAMATEGSGASTSRLRTLIPTCCTCFSQSSTTEDKVNAISTRLKDLAEAKGTLGLIVKEGKSKNMSARLETTSLVDKASIVGRQGEKDALLRMVLGDEACDQNFKIVPIVGMGGIGKTTLARLLYNDALVKEHFELKAWVCVSDDFDISKITKIILQAMPGDDNKEFASLDQLQVALEKKLSGKRFLLVLDDVWSESSETWRTLAQPFLSVASGSKVIITTRKHQLLTQLGYNQPYRLPILSDDEALCLFAKHALGKDDFESHSKLKPYGEEIVKRCKGLPLALIALGGLLRTKEKEEDWVELLNSEIWRSQNGEGIIPALRLSYQDLPAHLKQLFAYCSLFPKDYVFDKEELVLLWTAEGFLQESAASSSTRSLGHKYFDELLSRSFFEHASNEESLYVMHDLMNDLAMFVAGDFFFRLDGEMTVEGRSEALEKYRHVSFVRQQYEVYGRFQAFERAKHLRTFLALSVDLKSWQAFYLSNKTLTELLPQLPLLRVLSLSVYRITEVPESICSLKHLRYLNLSRTFITHLPEQVGNLYNLQILLVFGCRHLKKLPDSFFRLKNLQHIDISDTPLMEKIDELKRTLSNVTIQIRRDRFVITELKELENSDENISISGLDEVKNPVDVANLLQKKELGDLKMEWSRVFDGGRDVTLEKEVLGVLKPHNGTLRKLEMVRYGGVEFPSWVGDPCFQRLEHLTIDGCERCTSLPPLGQLPLLKELVVRGMDGVKVVGCEILGNGGDVAFPSLEILCFGDMKGWEEWSTNSGVTPCQVFPRLLKVVVDNCPNLVEVSLEEPPSLYELDIGRCREVVMTSVVRGAPLITSFEIEKISGLNQLHPGVIESLSRVERISIHDCDEMTYLWESEAEACKILVNLRKLVVWECKNLVGLGDEEEVHCLTSLRQLKILICDNLERLSCPNSIEVLEISSCSSITCVSYPTGRPKLKTLVICNCEKLVMGEKGSEILDSSMSSIEDIYIENWSNLKLFPDMRSFIHLRTLCIIKCNLESFPDEQLPCLVSLTELVIKYCPSMEDSFPRGLWPPGLIHLDIGGLKKPISEWGQQNFPTSLVTLSITGHSSDDVGTSTQLSLLLQSSLTELTLISFEKLESLSTGLQHLTTLQHLSILDCPTIRDLPETLLPSLLSLKIYKCPKLKERYNRRSSRWPLISHIPEIRIRKVI